MSALPLTAGHMRCSPPLRYRDMNDEELLRSDDAEAFGAFYRRHARPLAGWFARRTRDADAAADLTAETFAAALVARRRFRPGRAPARAWLYGIAGHKLADWQRSGYAEARARNRLGMERIELTDDDRREIGALDDVVIDMVEELPAPQRDAITEHVIGDRGYAEIAKERGVSEVVVRKQVSRGLRSLRRTLGREP